MLFRSHFFVAHIEEGIALRQVVPEHPIYVLNGLLPGTEGDFVEHRLIPAMNHLAQLNTWRAAAQRFNRTLDAVIHIDTGMHRLGFGPDEVQALINDRGRLRGLRLALIMSHLVASEEQQNPINGEQLSRFRTIVKAMPGAPTSLANSSGIFLGPDYHFDLLRPGAALYGINPLPGQSNPMLPVVTLHARILQTRRVEAFQTVGYGGAWRATRPSRVATKSNPSPTASVALVTTQVSKRRKRSSRRIGARSSGTLATPTWQIGRAHV